MKRKLYLTTAFIAVFLLALSMLLQTDVKVVSAATTPSFEKTKLELVGEGASHQMTIKNQIANSTYSWSSSDTTVATVTKDGLITAVGKGTAKVTCKVTYPSGKTKKTKTLSCTVTVTVPATSIKINNANLVNGAHVLVVGESFDFNCNILPEKHSDKVYWSIAGGDTACVRMDDAENGKITAVKPGKAILYVYAAKSATQDAANQSLVRDAIIVEVVEAEQPTASVKNVRIDDSNHISVEFDNPVAASTVVSGNGELSSNIELTLGKDSKKLIAEDPGKLKANLSSDGKVLTISTEKALNGTYVISFSSQIQTASGINLTETFRKITYTDITPPSILYTAVDDTGLIATIYFSEPINVSKMNIGDVSTVTTSGDAASSSTLSILKNPMNYMLSEDKKSLTIDMTNIAYTDRNKTFKVVITGITDMAGNAPAKMYVEAYVKTDTTYKPQARIRSVVRTGYNTITVTFDRAIDPLNPGYIQIDGGTTIQGKVDSKESNKVNYTISDADASYTGTRKISVGYWSSYNVDPTDTTAYRTYDYNVVFVADKTAPILLAYDYNPEDNVLTLNYNENVTITSAAGTLASTFTSSNEDIRLINIGYTEIPHTEGGNIIKLRVTNLTLAGNYNVTIPKGFVSDSFRNLSESTTRTIVIESNRSGYSSSELPAPYYIAQNADDLSKITIKFANKLDTASALSVNNYKISGASVSSVQLLENTAETGATVVLTIADNTIEYDLEYKLVISGVKGFNNSYSAISYYEYPIKLKENKKPTYVPSPVLDKSNLSTIKISFSEKVHGSMNVRISQIVSGSTYEIPVTSVEVVENYALINLAGVPYNNTVLYIDVISYDIKDANGNSLSTMPSRLPMTIKY